MSFTKEELALIRDRLEVERANGPDVYSPEELAMMDQIIEKIDENNK